MSPRKSPKCTFVVLLAVLAPVHLAAGDLVNAIGCGVLALGGALLIALPLHHNNL
jgi:hypothetical protein